MPVNCRHCPRRGAPRARRHARAANLYRFDPKRFPARLGQQVDVFMAAPQGSVPAAKASAGD